MIAGFGGHQYSCLGPLPWLDNPSGNRISLQSLRELNPIPATGTQLMGALRA